MLFLLTMAILAMSIGFWSNGSIAQERDLPTKASVCGALGKINSFIRTSDRRVSERMDNQELLENLIDFYLPLCQPMPTTEQEEEALLRLHEVREEIALLTAAIESMSMSNHSRAQINEDIAELRKLADRLEAELDEIRYDYNLDQDGLESLKSALSDPAPDASPSYKSAAFQCFGDFHVCEQSSSGSSITCGLQFLLCTGVLLIPLAGG